MVDKGRITSHIKDLDLKKTIYKVIDKALGVLKNHDYRYTDFLNPYELKNAIAALNSIDDIKYSVYGGYDGSERKVIYIYPYYVSEEDIDSPISALTIEGNFKFKEVSHKDYLGSILGLGIKREKIGDILIHKSFCQVVVQTDIKDYIILNMTKVARNNISVKEISISEIKKVDINYKEIGFTVSSNRIDSIVSSIYNISRQEANKIISSNRVYVDYEPINNISKKIDVNSLISVRGKGRCIICDIGDVNKKGRLRVKVKIIL
ncbi:YlmH family RNA-binding protein [Tepidibacter aestuarii]|uniref:YlmH family RNA-binding protein n=1 Tax=Tepidibacter aestuarii TaxID=2925782 RepID=UPI0020C0F919|nr:YlmH/Sll1252 family protein [Tepidibacter aestuarii]CAH2212777.1 RNA-binding protein YlmH, contains S4-like domain [Tepidibacter aestuarii]